MVVVAVLTVAVAATVAATVAVALSFVVSVLLMSVFPPLLTYLNRFALMTDSDLLVTVTTTATHGRQRCRCRHYYHQDRHQREYNELLHLLLLSSSTRTHINALGRSLSITRCRITENHVGCNP